MHRAWDVFDYEVSMWNAMVLLLQEGNPNYAQLQHEVKNAVVESVILHTRILVDILLSSQKYVDDMCLDHLGVTVPKADLDQLKSAYGTPSAVGSPCWAFNKMLAHATTNRSSTHDYTGALNSLRPVVQSILAVIDKQRSL